MPKKRKAIRDHVAQKIRDADLEVGQRVWTGRSKAVRRQDIPGAIVYTASETASQEATGDRLAHLRQCLVTIDVILALGEDIDDRLDALAYAIEDAVLTDPTMGGNAEWVALQSVDTDIVRLGNGGPEIGVAKIQMEARYMTVHALPEIDDYEVDEVYVGIAPKAGPDHKDDYTQVV